MKASVDKLAVLSDVERRLAAIQTVDEAKALRDQAEAIRVYAKSARKGLAIQNRAAAIRILAEQRAGALLKRMMTTLVIGERTYAPARGGFSCWQCDRDIALDAEDLYLATGRRTPLDVRAVMALFTEPAPPPDWPGPPGPPPDPMTEEELLALYWAEGVARDRHQEQIAQSWSGRPWLWCRPCWEASGELCNSRRGAR